MWIWLALASAILLGFYDVAKKYSLKRNGIYFVILAATGFTAVFLCPFLSPGPAAYHLKIAVKAVIVTATWLSGMEALRLLPITTVSTFKASRPMFVVLFSILLFGERLNLWHWLGVAAVLVALWLLGAASGREGFRFGSGRGFWALIISMVTGVASALWDKYIISSFVFEGPLSPVYAALPENLQVPLFLQSWTNVYITILLAVIVAVKAVRDGERRERFRWDWSLLAIAVLITFSDAIYFLAINQEGSLLSVISLVRRFSIVVTFFVGAIIFREGKIKGKSAALAFMIVGILLLMYGSL
ncbi:MAG: DMT family transporter [Bacteroidales bacterium]|nr:DMT family transporter [Bacteroidales bacterium]